MRMPNLLELVFRDGVRDDVFGMTFRDRELMGVIEEVVCRDSPRLVKDEGEYVTNNENLCRWQNTERIWVMVFGDGFGDGTGDCLSQMEM
jgi:hypothetical protein